ncbi:MAG: peptidoglycan-associated lipoprotein Pal [Gemmatimonadota bacterium]
MRRDSLVAGAFLILSVAVTACSRNPPPEPAPVPDTTTATPSADTASDAARREAEANRLCERALAAMESGDYQTARELLQQVVRDYPGTECAGRAPAELERANVLEAITARIHFEFDMWRITNDAAAVLQRKAEALRAHPSVQLTIEGHCDERGSLEYNQALGLRRAEEAKQYLVNLGLDTARFRTVSYGEERPLQAASDEAAWAQNRRAEFAIVAGEI